MQNNEFPNCINIMQESKINYEIEYSWLLKKAYDYKDLENYCYYLNEDLINRIQEINLMISGANIDYNSMKKHVTKSCVCFSGVLLGITALLDYLTDLPDFYMYIWYLISIAKPAIIGPLMYKDNIEKLENESIKIVDALNQQLDDLEYIAWAQKNIFNNLENNYGLSNLEWRGLNETQSILMTKSAPKLSKRYY